MEVCREGLSMLLASGACRLRTTTTKVFGGWGGMYILEYVQCMYAVDYCSSVERSLDDSSHQRVG